jgi:hypothetical protein
MGRDPSGAAVKKKWLANAEHLKPRFIDLTRGCAGSHPAEHDYFGRALLLAVDGDATELKKYLSDRPLNGYERQLIATLLEDYFATRKRYRGRPANFMPRVVAAAALHFYQDWRADNKTRGINDRGQSAAMKDEAVRFIIEELDPSLLEKLTESDQAAARELMDRPASRR